MEENKTDSSKSIDLSIKSPDLYYNTKKIKMRLYSHFLISKE